MLQIAGYQIHEQIHRSPRSSVYRGQRELDGAAVVLKVLNDELPSAEVVARFKREFEMGKLAAGQGAVPVLALEPVRGSWALVMEDVGARSLRSVLDERRLDLEEAVAIGARIAAALVELHALRIVHKDVNPANIVVVPSTGAVRLIDFGL
ncbi:MAG TPA: protein kinase, partial [Polyangia bacterium]|nr:protein kinase [Polyangia bacterium]